MHSIYNIKIITELIPLTFQFPGLQPPQDVFSGFFLSVRNTLPFKMLVASETGGAFISANTAILAVLGSSWQAQLALE